MSEGVNLKKWIAKFFSEDLKVIITFLVVILLIASLFSMMMGFLALDNTSFNTPSISPANKGGLRDSDHDSLPDIIEGTAAQPCTRGDPVYHDGKKIGTCTQTDPYSIDTDHDGFTDAVEDSLGTNPTNFWSPGFVYIIFLMYLGVFLFFRYYHTDPLKEYKEFELKSSSGVSGGGSKFAYGGSSVFGEKKAAEVTSEERKEAIQADPRVQRMIAEGGFETEKFEKKRNWGVLLLQLVIASLVAVFIFVALRQT